MRWRVVMVEVTSKQTRPAAARNHDAGARRVSSGASCFMPCRRASWDATPVEEELLGEADRLVGCGDAVLVIDDTAMPKKGTHSVGVAAQYASGLGKTTNCQTLVSLTLARGEVPVMLALRLFLPESWTSDCSRADPGKDCTGTLMTMIAYAFLQYRRLPPRRSRQSNRSMQFAMLRDNTTVLPN
jgi:SRSO17 transposase